MGHNFKIATLYAPPYVTVLEKIKDQYHLEGMFIEVFHALQVRKQFKFVFTLQSFLQLQCTYILGCYEFYVHGASAC